MKLLLLSMILLSSAAIANDRFTVGKSNSTRWSLKTPSGDPFWSFGVCCVDPGETWDNFKPENPSYRGWTLFPNAKSWADDTIQKLESWGFNTVGGWGDYKLFNKHAAKTKLPYTVVLHLGAYYRAPWDDIFSKEAFDAIDKAANEQITPIKDDPKLIGYFSDNELGWWDDTVFLNYTKLLPENSAGRKKAHSTLKSHYKDSFAEFKKDWNTSATTWTDLAKKPDHTLKPGGKGMQAVNAWMRVIGDHYYKTMNQAIKRYDPNRLVMGDRYCQYYNIELARSSAKWIDVCSTNMGADWTDGTFTPFFLDTLHKLTKKPVMITEFYMTAMENRSGNKNSSANFPVVQTQKERAAAFTNNLSEFAKVPYLIGAHWFQMHDEPMHGRGDGENYNMGLIDIYGQQYDEMVDAAKSFDLNALLKSEAPKAMVNSMVPSVSFDPMSTPSLKLWPRKEGWVEPSTGDAFADIFVAKDTNNLYVSLYAMNYIDEKLYADGIIPETERPHWQLQVGNVKADIRFGGAKTKGVPLSAVSSNSQVKLIEAPNLKHTIIVSIPLASAKLSNGQISLSSTVQTHSRGETMTWNKTLTP